MRHVAVDLGAGSGRVELGSASPRGIELVEVHRFTYAPRYAAGHLRWDIERLFDGLRRGLALAAQAARHEAAEIASIGVDSWGVDYGLLDASGTLLEEPISYRDARTAPDLVGSVLARIPRDELFARTGVQLLPINTLFQLAAHVREGVPARAARLLFIPDLCHHLLCGSSASERTDASTSQLLRAGAAEWDDELFERLGLPRELMPPVVEAGEELGRLAPAIRDATGLGRVPIVAPATHDTASAVVGTPLEDGVAFISSGTWSLVGVERSGPVLGPAAAALNVTNEAGAFGTTRVLKNVTGLWMLEECRREWGSAAPDAPELLARVAGVSDTCGTVNPDDPRFLNPPSMVTAVRQALVERGCAATDDPVVLAKIVLDSLACRYAEVIDGIERVTGSPIRTIHIVGGGSRNGYLNQATANAARRPVLAGPVEATAMGNVMVQAIAGGTFASLAEARSALARSVSPAVYLPCGQDNEQ